MKVLVLGGGGFIGHHLARRLLHDGHFVVCVDIKEENEFCANDTFCSHYIQADLREPASVDFVLNHYKYDEIYQLAADMGGAGYVFTGAHDFDIMHNSATINLNVLSTIARYGIKAKVFYSSSACIYPQENQEDPNNPVCSESSAYPANPDSEYGWEKLFSERLYLSAKKNYGIDVHIARFHNIFGPEGTWTGGKEKAPAALSRKIAEIQSGGTVEVWGSGNQTRSFLYIDECVDGVLKLTRSHFTGPFNIGSEEMVSINGLVKLIAQIAGKDVIIKNITGPEGVKGRNSDNKLIRQYLEWEPTRPLRVGLEKTYSWVAEQVDLAKNGTTQET